MRIVVYTCITENYDFLPVNVIKSDNIEFVCLTDNNVYEENSEWKYVNINYLPYKGKKLNRYAKFFPHKFFEDYDCSIYVDGNIAIVSDLYELVDSVLASNTLALYEHPIRSSIMSEALECSWRGFTTYWTAMKQIRRYISDGFVDDKLFECSIIFRKHDSSLEKLSEMWWQEFINNARRDQLSLNYSAWKTDIKIYDLGKSDLRFTNKYFKYSEIQKKHNRSKKVKITSLFNKIIMLFSKVNNKRL